MGKSEEGCQRESSSGVIHPTWVHTPIHKRAAIATPPTATDMMLRYFLNWLFLGFNYI